MSIFGSLTDLRSLRREIDGSVQRASALPATGVSSLVERVLPMLADLAPRLLQLFERRASAVGQAAERLGNRHGLVARSASQLVATVRQRPMLALGLVTAATWLAVRQVQAMRR